MLILDRVLFGVSFAILVYMIALNAFYSLRLVVAATVFPKRYKQYWFTKGIRLTRKIAKPISLLVPAHNEDKNIIDAVRSFLSLNYETYEVIVSNDGSNDKTLEKLIAAFDLVQVDVKPNDACDSKPIKAVYFSKSEPKLVVVDKENGGKADAQNAAARVARFPYFCVVDADTLLDKDSLNELAIRFAAEPTIVAIGGIVRVVNGCAIEKSVVTEVAMPRGFIERIQVLEYMRAFLFGRVSSAAMHTLLLISGAFGVFRRDAFTKIRGWNRQAIGEDMDAVVRIQRAIFEEKLDWKVDFLPHPISWTQVPLTWKSLGIQRERWQRGLMQVLFGNIKMLLNPRYGKVGMIGFPYFFILEMLSSVFEFACYPLTIVAVMLGAVNSAYEIYFASLMVTWGLCISFTTILLHENVPFRYKSAGDLKNLLCFAVYENIGYRQIHSFWRLWGLLKYIFVPSSRSSGMSGWTSIERVSFAK